MAVAGAWLTSVQNEALRLDVYLVAVAPAPGESEWTFEGVPLFEQGDPVVTLQYVVTNVGEEDLVLPNGDMRISLNYADSGHSATPSEFFWELVESQGVPNSPIDFTATAGETDWNLPIGPGRSVSWAEAYWYDEGADALLSLELNEFVDGEMDGDRYVIDAETDLVLRAP
ncbi:hypothetical protein [Occultella gossypii]|uniref:DUF4352 domain-containing protein n=1 Tax=Occultella gossypii TaxID=2800820 RepID=A0ABS7S5F6_9MICO|nr:hypothetical protein [Occultella gossypii]MBZ2195569.1 hypothetical protein [Occultella gossypii]